MFFHDTLLRVLHLIIASAKKLGIPPTTLARLFAFTEDVKFAAGDYYLCAPPDMVFQTTPTTSNCPLTGQQQSPHNSHSIWVLPNPYHLYYQALQFPLQPCLPIFPLYI